MFIRKHFVFKRACNIPINFKDSTFIGKWFYFVAVVMVPFYYALNRCQRTKRDFCNKTWV